MNYMILMRIRSEQTILYREDHPALSDLLTPIKKIIEIDAEFPADRLGAVRAELQCALNGKEFDYTGKFMIVWIIRCRMRKKSVIGKTVRLIKDEHPNTVLVDGDEMRDMFTLDAQPDAHSIAGRRFNTNAAPVC